jgi:hypothetical protein
VINGPGWTAGVEAETHVRDIQAVARRLALKRRDGALDAVVLVLRDSRHHRRLVRMHADALAASFPIPGRRALRRLATGASPGGSAVVLV